MRIEPKFRGLKLKEPRMCEIKIACFKARFFQMQNNGSKLLIFPLCLSQDNCLVSLTKQ